MQCHKTVTWKSHGLRMTMRHGSTPAIARNLEIELTSTLQRNHLQPVVPRPPAHPEGNRQGVSPQRSEPFSKRGHAWEIFSPRGVAALRCRLPLDPAVALNGRLVIELLTMLIPDNDPALTSAL